MSESKDARPLRFGEALPRLHAVSNRNPRFALGSLGGRFVLFCVLGDVASHAAQAALAALSKVSCDEGQRLCAVFCADAKANPNLFDEIAKDKVVFNDPEAARESGLLDARAPEGRWLLLDPSLRVIGLWQLANADAALAALAQTPAPSDHAGAPLYAPVLIAPRVFEPDFCKRLIDYYRNAGGEPSGVTQERADGMTFVQLQDTFKRRSDCLIDDAQLREAAMQRIYWRLGPEIEKAFAWRPTRMERYLVARYDAEIGGFFKPHRDNTTKGTAHRRFAVTINLNANEYEGGDLRFPEFGARTYRAPTGGAVVFSCSLLHEATPVTRGERFAFLPFLYDEEAAKVREANDKFLDESIRPYRRD
jgi:predicted 2-oxoglutarate/Fe(II)-dependent dioxygenase YbiX